MTVNTPGCMHFTGMAEPALGLGNAAHEYAQLGYEVLPLHRGGKRPDGDLVPHGVRDASRDVRAWRERPAANVGVATGQASGIVVVDLDVKNGVNGPAEFDRMRGSNAIGRTGTVRTPSGGWHLYYLWPDGGGPVPNKIGVLPGVDIKGDGGYVVAPPSALLIPGMSRPGEMRGGATVPIPYEWVRGCACRLAVVPEWMQAWALAAQPVAVVEGNGSGEPVSDEMITTMKRDGIPVGERNVRLYATACSLHRRNEKTDVFGELLEIGIRSGLGYREVETINESAARFVAAAKEADQAMWEAAKPWLNPRVRSDGKAGE